MKVWITKYALTSGIIEVDKASEFKEGSISYKYKSNYAQFAHSKEWHKTEQEALERAEEMRLNKIESLKKKILKLEGMSFK